MRRILEAELMTEEEQARVYAGADFAEAHESYVRLFGDCFPDAPIAARVLDIGCGPADVTRRFAHAYPGWTFDGLDGSSAMLTEARRALSEQPGLAARIMLIQAVLPDAVLPTNAYDVVLSTSLLHHLHDPLVLWETVLRHAAPRAPLFVADLRRPESVGDARSLVDRYAPGEPEVLRRDFFNSLCASFTPDEVREQLALAGLTSFRVETISDRHLVVWGRMP